MKQTSMIKFTSESEQGLRQLRKDAGKAGKWIKRKYSLRKLRKMKIAEKERNLIF